MGRGAKLGGWGTFALQRHVQTLSLQPSCSIHFFFFTHILFFTFRGNVSHDNRGLGVERPAELSHEDDEYDAYRKRMMLAYRFRPNPLVSLASSTISSPVSLSFRFFFFFRFSPHLISKATCGWAIQILNIASWREQENTNCLTQFTDSDRSVRAEKYCFWCFNSCRDWSKREGNSSWAVASSVWWHCCDQTSAFEKKVFFTMTV